MEVGVLDRVPKPFDPPRLVLCLPRCGAPARPGEALARLCFRRRRVRRRVQFGQEPPSRSTRRRCTVGMQQIPGYYGRQSDVLARVNSEVSFSKLFL